MFCYAFLCIAMLLLYVDVFMSCSAMFCYAFCYVLLWFAMFGYAAMLLLSFTMCLLCFCYVLLCFCYVLL